MYKLIALTLLLSNDVESKSLHPLVKGKHQFIQDIRRAQKVHGKLPRKLSHDRLIAKSVHKPGLRSAQVASEHQVTSEAESRATEATAPENSNHRELSWWTNFWSGSSQNNNAEDMDGEVDNMDGEQAEGSQSWWSTNGWGGGYNSEDDMWQGSTNSTYATESLADFSIKYAGCSALTSFVESDDGSYPFVNQNFVSYRLCPSESCADDTWQGCKSQYGEYMMNLEDFLNVQQDYLDEEFEYYCNFCEQCMYFDKYFSGGGQDGCVMTDQCQDYYDFCSDEARKQIEEEADFNLDDFFECQEINIFGGNDDQDGGDGYYDKNYVNSMDDKYDVAFQNGGVAYVGTHCINGEISIGLFADDQCTSYIGNQIDFFNATQMEIETSVVEELYAPDGCVACNGDNIYSTGYFFTTDEKENEEYDKMVEEMEQNGQQEFVSEICYNMYIASAKCHMHFGDDISDALEVSENEMLDQQTTCDFIEDVMKNRIDDEGFVYSHQNVRSNPIADYLGMFGADDMETNPTAAQWFGLVASGAACAAMGFLAWDLKKKVDVSPANTEKLIANEDAVRA